MLSFHWLSLEKIYRHRLSSTMQCLLLLDKFVAMHCPNCTATMCGNSQRDCCAHAVCKCGTHKLRSRQITGTYRGVGFIISVII